jgi:glycerate-2-kinase
LAIDTLVELTKDNHTDSTRFAAATALLDRGYGRPAQSLDLHLSADAITKRLSDMTDAELAALEARMIAAAPIVLEATAEVSDGAGELPDGDAEDSPPDAPA